MSKRIVVKVGTKVLSADGGKLDVAILKHLVEQIIVVKNQGIEVILVTSGAMGAGRSLMSVRTKEKIAEKQVLAAVGQVKLMSTYSNFFEKKDKICAQVLATKEDFRDKVHYLNMRTCFENLLKNDVIPVVNENDVVATTELLFTDNDELAGLVASQLNADAVIILTSVDGFLTGDPKDKNSVLIPEIDFSDSGMYQKYISSDKTEFGRGGMLTKFNIARTLALQGITVYLANGKRKNILSDIISGKKVGTKFLPKRRVTAVKRRIAHSEGLEKGCIQINECAEELLLSKTKIMSLLPVGVTKVSGNFEKGDIIEIIGTQGKKIGYGIAEYNAVRAKELAGLKKARPVIHYDHMFIE
ncbi:MAG: glutamate 5-kinase [Patescibacteria group bacterium]